MWAEYKFSIKLLKKKLILVDIKTLVMVCFQDNWKNSQTLNNASQWTNKDQQVQTILVRSTFISSKPTHPQFEANEDSLGLWQQLTNCTSNLWKHRSQLIFLQKQQKLFSRVHNPPLSSFNFLKRRLLVFLSTVRCYHCETHSQKDLHFEAPISLLIIEVQHFAASTPFLLLIT
jgi:hypothetical protein